MILSNSDIGIPFQIAFPDSQNYIYKKINSSSTWSKMNAGYADSAYSSTISTTASKLGRDGNTSVPMTFNWSGQSGQPQWLWGGTDGTNMYVYNPANFSVNYAASAGSAGYITDGVTIGSDYKTTIRTTMNGTYDTRSFVKPIRCNTANVDCAPRYGSGICFGREDTQGYLYMNYSSANAYIGGGNTDKLNWVRRILLDGDSIDWNNVSNKPSIYHTTNTDGLCHVGSSAPTDSNTKIWIQV